MLIFLAEHASAFLTIGISVVAATLLRGTAQFFADRKNEEKNRRNSL